MVQVIFSANNNEEIMVLPYVPPGTAITQDQANEEFKTTTGVLNLIGNMGLKHLSIASFFPTQEYKWIPKEASADGWEYVDFFNKWRDAKVPVRIVVISKQNKEILNMACLIDSFSYSEKRNGDISYSLEVSEYRFVEV